MARRAGKGSGDGHSQGHDISGHGGTVPKMIMIVKTTQQWAATLPGKSGPDG